MDFLWRNALKEVQEVLQFFFEDFKPKTTSSILQGFVHEFTDLRLKPDALHALSIPLQVEEGLVGKIQTNLDIASMFTGKEQRFSVFVKNVRLKVSPSVREQLSVPTLKEINKSLELVLAELFNNVIQKSGGAGFYALFLRSKVAIEDLSIVYTDGFERFETELTVHRIHQKQSRRQRVPETHYAVEKLKLKVIAAEPGEGTKVDFRETVVVKPLSFVVVLHHRFVPTDDSDTKDKEAAGQRVGRERQDSLSLSKDSGDEQGARAPAAGGSGSNSGSAEEDEPEFLSEDEDVTLEEKRKLVEADAPPPNVDSYGFTAALSLLTTLDLTLSPSVLAMLSSVLRKSTQLLFTQARAPTASLDLLRWLPVRGHHQEYWQFVLRQIMPEAVRRVADSHQVKFPSTFSAEAYAPLNPYKHKTTYIDLYQRSLNLIGSEPLNPHEEAEKKQLESLHALETILIWRTQAKIMLIMERPAANLRVERQEYKDIEGGLLAAIFGRQSVNVADIGKFARIKETNPQEARMREREAYRQAVLSHTNRSTTKRLEGIALVMRSQSEHAARIRFQGDRHVTFDFTDLLLDLSYSDKGLTVQFQSDRFRERLSKSERPHLLAQNDGVLSVLCKLPSNPKEPDSFYLFGRYLEIVSVRKVVRYFVDFFSKPAESARMRIRRYSSSNAILAAEAAAKSKAAAQRLKDAILRVVLADSSVNVEFSPLKGTRDSVLFELGDPERTLFGQEAALMHNADLMLKIFPKDKRASARLCLKKSQAWWTTAASDEGGAEAADSGEGKSNAAQKRDASGELGPDQAEKEGKGDAVSKKRKHKKKHPAENFTELLSYQIDDWALEAKLGRVKETKLDRLRVDGNLSTLHLRITPRILAQLLRVAADVVRSSGGKRNRARWREAYGKPLPFSAKMHADTVRITVEEAPDDDAEQDGAANGLAPGQACLDVSLAAARFGTSEVRRAPSRKPTALHELIGVFYQDMVEHLQEGFVQALQPLAPLAGAPASTSAGGKNRGFNVLLAPAIERIRALLRNPAVWPRHYLEKCYLDLRGALLFDVNRHDRTRMRGASCDSIEAVLPQSLFRSLLNAFHLQQLMQTVTMTAEQKKLAQRLDCINDNFFAVVIAKAQYAEDLTAPHLLHSRPRPKQQAVLRKLEQYGHVVTLSKSNLAQVPSMVNQAFSIGMQNFVAVFSAQNRTFFRINLEDFAHSTGKSLEAELEPSVTYDAFRLQFDTALFVHLLRIYTHRSDSLLSVVDVSPWVTAGLELFFVLNSYAERTAIEDPQGASKQVQVTLNIDQFDWEFVRQQENDREFKLNAKMLLALPYAFFAEELKQEPLALLWRAQAELLITQRKTYVLPRELWDSSDREKRSSDTFESITMIGFLKNLEVLHALPGGFMQNAAGYSRAGSESPARRLSSFEASKAAAPALEAPQGKQPPSAATEQQERKTAQPEEDDVALASDDDAGGENDAKAFEVKREDSPAHAPMPSAAAGAPVSDVVVTDIETGTVKHVTLLLPPLPIPYPIPNATIRDKAGTVLWRNVSQVLHPTRLNVHISYERSGLQPHSTAEESKLARKMSGRRSQLFFEVPDELTLHISQRDAHFLVLSAKKLLELLGKAEKEERQNMNHDDTDVVSLAGEEDGDGEAEEKKLAQKQAAASASNAEKKSGAERAPASPRGATIEVSRGVLMVVDELEATLRAKALRVCLLDEQSDQRGKDPICELSFGALSAWYTAFGSKQSVEVDTTLSVAYGAVPDPIDRNQKARADPDRAENMPFNEPCSIRMQLERNLVPSTDRPTAASLLLGFRSVYSAQLSIRKGLLAMVSPALLQRTAPRLMRFIAAHGGAAFKSEKEDWGELQRNLRARMFDERRLVNESGGPLWFELVGQQTAGGRHALKDRDSARLAFRDPNNAAVRVHLDGSWSPSIVALVAPAYWKVHRVTSTMAPGFRKAEPRALDVIVEAVEVPSASSNVADDTKERKDIHLHVHSTVCLVNHTSEPVSVQGLAADVDSKQTCWLPLMMAATGSLVLRPTAEYNWSALVVFGSPSAAAEGGETAGEYPKFFGVPCLHVKSQQEWTYSVAVEKDARGVVTVHLRPPLVIENRLPSAVLVTIARRAKELVRFFHVPTSEKDATQAGGEVATQAAPDAAAEKPAGKTNAASDAFETAPEAPRESRITEHFERGHILENDEWSSYGGWMNDQAELSIQLIETTTCRVDGFENKLRINMSSAAQLAEGFTLVDNATGRRLRVFVVEMPPASPAESKVSRRLRLFTHYIFVDRTGLQLRFSEDRESYMSSYAPDDPDWPGEPYENLYTPFDTKVMFSSDLVEAERRVMHVSSPLVRAWSPAWPLWNMLGARAEQVGGGAPRDEALEPLVLRVPVAGARTPVAADAAALALDGESAALRGKFASEVVMRVDESSISDHLQQRGPLVLECIPRVRIVNRLGCGLAVRRFAVSSFRGDGTRDLEMPMFVPASQTSALIFFNGDFSEDAHPRALDLKSISFQPVFMRSDSAQPLESWEWSEAIQLADPTSFTLSFHNTALSRRLIADVKIEVAADGFAHTLTFTNRDPRTVLYKVQNQSTYSTVRFSQKVFEAYDPLSKSRFWQTAAPGEPAALYAWDDPTYYSLDMPHGLQAFQWPLLLTVRVLTGEEELECDVDLEFGRLGTRHRLRTSGPLPDILVHTRTEVSTGAIVVVVSDYENDGGYPASLFDSEEKSFVMALIRQGGHVHKRASDAGDGKGLVGSDEARGAAFEMQAERCPNQPQQPRAQTNTLEVRIQAMFDVEFRETSTVVYVISFAKSTRKAIMDVRQVRRNSFSPHVFAFNKFYLPAEVDYDTILIDFYERHSFTGTTLKYTATLKDVHRILAVCNPAVAQVVLHSVEVRRVGSSAQAPGRAASTPSLHLQILRSEETAPGVPGLPGRQLLQVSCNVPELELQLNDYDATRLLRYAHSKLRRTAAKGLEPNDLAFACILVKNLTAVVAHSHTHRVADFAFGGAEVEQRPSKERLLELARSGISNLGRHNQLLLLTETVPDRPWLHTQMLWRVEPEPNGDPDDPRLQRVAEKLALTVDSTAVKLDGPALLRLARYARWLRLFGVSEEARAAATQGLGILVRRLIVNVKPFIASFETVAMRKDLSVAELARSLQDSIVGLVSGGSKSGASQPQTTGADATATAKAAAPPAEQGLLRRPLDFPQVDETAALPREHRMYESDLIQGLAIALARVWGELPRHAEALPTLLGYEEFLRYRKHLERSYREIRAPLLESEQEVYDRTRAST